MNELFLQKIEDAQKGRRARGMDIMGALVRTAYGDRAESAQHSSAAQKDETGRSRSLSDSDILGNAFVMILAGHETTANAIHFTLAELAMNGTAQRRVRNEVRSIFSDTPPETWDYESSINKLLGGFTGAVLNEQLRLMPPVTAIPKSVPKDHDQIISIDGKRVRLPAGSHINLCTIGVHRNRKYWPSQPSALSDRLDDLDDFKPDRWFTRNDKNVKQQTELSTGSGDEETGDFTGPVRIFDAQPISKYFHCWLAPSVVHGFHFQTSRKALTYFKCLCRPCIQNCSVR